MAAASKNAPIPFGTLEWEPIKPAVRRRLQSCFDHAEKRLKAKGGKVDHDYAHDMLTQCVKNDPGNLVYVEAMLDNLQTKHKNNKKGGGGGGNRGPFKKAQKENNWEEILKTGPELLKSNPWDKTLLEPMADACGVYGFNEVELRYLKNALDANLKDVEVNKHCAATLARVGQFDQAIACWRRIGTIRGKNDTEVDNMISDLMREKTQILTGLGDDDKATGRVVKEGLSEKEAKEVKATVGVQQEEPAKQKKVELTLRQKLERAIADDPEVVENYLQLAQLHQSEGRAAEAVKALTAGLAASGGDFRVQEKLEDAQILQMKQQLAVAEKRAKSDPSEEAAALVKSMRDQLYRQELENYTGRASRQPDDLALQYQLAVRLKRVGNFAEAEKVLTAVRQDPKLKTAATIELGECLQQQQKYAGAMQCYARAVELAEGEQSAGQGDENVAKLALYRAGILATGLKQYDAAIKYLQALSKIDARYRDVLTRLDKAKKMRDKG